MLAISRLLIESDARWSYNTLFAVAFTDHLTHASEASNGGINLSYAADCLDSANEGLQRMAINL